MAKLLVKGGQGPVQVLELKLGVNRFGRSAGNDFQIEHPTISAHHCEIELSSSGLKLRDCDSTNGTFINGEPVRKAILETGQTLQLGDVELYVETTDVNIAIPTFERPPDVIPPPIIVDDGSLRCPVHPKKQVTHQCTKCRLVMCGDCVRHVRRKAGKVVLLCPQCSSKVEPLQAGPTGKESLLSRLAKTIKLPFLRERKSSKTAKD